MRGRRLGGGQTKVRDSARRKVFGVPEYRSLWAAQLLSVAGDQLAKIALTVLVYDRTAQPVLAALTFATSFVGPFIGGIAFAGLADRYPRRAVMIACDLIRMILTAIMALPGVPVLVLVSLLFAVSAVSAPFTAARAAVYPDILKGDLYLSGTAITLTTNQVAQVVGFCAGGVMTSLLGARACLVVDSATFALSAILVRLGVAPRPAASQAADGHRRLGSGLVSGARLVVGNPALRAPMFLGWLAWLYNCGEAIAAPFARELAGGAVATGLLLAAPAAGYAIGAMAFSSLPDPARRTRLMTPLAIACCAALIPIALHPPLPVTLVILAISGALSCFQVAANAAFVRAAPPHQRSQAFGLAAGGMSLGQGAAMIAAGAAAQHLAPGTVISAAGAIGAAAAVVLSLARPDRSRPRLSPRPGTDR